MKRPFLYVAIAFSLGIVAATLFKIPFLYVFLLGAVSIALSIVYSKKIIASHINLYLAIFFLGMIFYQNSSTLPSNHISTFTPDGDKKVFLRGIVVDDPIVSDTFYKTKKASFLLNALSMKENSVWRFRPQLRYLAEKERRGEDS